jgi:predicted fused transcriptional regulator/phosphomethylpyrimidine kinase
MNNVAKNEVVALGGITGNTARRDVIEALGDRDFGESRHGGIMLTKFFESEHEGAAPQEIVTERVMQNLDLWLESGVVSGITVEVQADRVTSRIEYTEEQIQAAEAERAAAREVERDARAAAADEAERQAFIESAHHHEGVVVGIYSEHFAFDTHGVAGRDGIIVIDRRTEALRELDDPGWFMAINTRALSDDFDIATIQAGDIIAVWTDTENELIRYEDEAQLIPYVTAGILVVNDLHTYDRQGGW